MHIYIRLQEKKKKQQRDNNDDEPVIFHPPVMPFGIKLTSASVRGSRHCDASGRWAVPCPRCAMATVVAVKEGVMNK
jgi:hypothetical protein